MASQTLAALKYKGLKLFKFNSVAVKNTELIIKCRSFIGASSTYVDNKVIIMI